MTNLFSKWRAFEANTWFTTHSPYPETPCYIAPVPLMTIRNSSSYLKMGASLKDVKHYLEQQVLILKYNNPEHPTSHIKSIVISRIAHWQCNNILRKDAYYLGELLDSVIEECFSDDCTLTIKCANGTKYADTTRYWYSDEIMKMQADGSKSSQRAKAKFATRREVISGGYKDDFRVETYEYQADNYNVLPTVKILADNTGHSSDIINAHGKEFVISHLANSQQRVQMIREFNPGIKQVEVVKILGLSIRTVKKYWNIK